MTIKNGTYVIREHGPLKRVRDKRKQQSSKTLFHEFLFLGLSNKTQCVDVSISIHKNTEIIISGDSIKLVNRLLRMLKNKNQVHCVLNGKINSVMELVGMEVYELLELGKIKSIICPQDSTTDIFFLDRVLSKRQLSECYDFAIINDIDNIIHGEQTPGSLAPETPRNILG
jgi:hypothetical protein